MPSQHSLPFFFHKASLIRGNRANCALFCDNLDWLVSKLDRLEASSGDNTHTVLVAPCALCLFLWVLIYLDTRVSLHLPLLQKLDKVAKSVYMGIGVVTLMLILSRQESWRCCIVFWLRVRRCWILSRRITLSPLSLCWTNMDATIRCGVLNGIWNTWNPLPSLHISALVALFSGLGCALLSVCV